MKKLKGTVVSTKMSKTVVIEIRKTRLHPLYKKIVSQIKKIKAHTDKPLVVGDVVIIVPTRPISKEKHYRVSEVLTPAAKNS